MATGNVDETEDGRADRGGVTMVSVFFFVTLVFIITLSKRQRDRRWGITLMDLARCVLLPFIF